MAQIFFGFGSSHGPLLSSSPENWDYRTAADRANPAHPYRGKTYTFDQLVALRKDENLAALNRIEVRRERHARCQQQLDKLAERLEEVSPDVIVLVGDDQHEWFRPEMQPPFAVFHGKTVLNSAFDEEAAKKVPPGQAEVMRDRHPTPEQHYPVDTSLAAHIIDRAIEEEFDVATLAREPHNAAGPIGVGHAVQFIYRRILRDRLNTFFPPNQPTPKRCFDFGRLIGRAVASWDSNKRVAVCASGGLSHFVIDEDFDHRIIQAFLANDKDALLAEPKVLYESGTSEVKNWITVAGILSETKLRMKLLDYVPCYRSEAGTGNAMAFATWE
jgi:aromatic ring-opening dioxygenase LigB subunit